MKVVAGRCTLWFRMAFVNVQFLPVFYHYRKEKELNSKGYMLDMRSPIHRSSPVQPVINSVSSPAVALTTSVADAWQTDHPFSHILRRELERSIRKHTRTGMSV